MDDQLAHLSEKIKKALKEDLISFSIEKGELTLQVKCQNTRLPARS